MTRWDELYRYMRGMEAERLEAERRRREGEAGRDALDAWARHALDEVWVRVRAALAERADELARATGRRISVLAHPPAVTGAGGLPALHVIELRLDTSVVYVYSHHFSGAPPNVHLGYWPVSESGRRHHRLLSLPMAALERRGESGWLLRRTVPARPHGEVSIDDVVFRAFELLVHGVVRDEPRVNPPPSVDPNRTLPYGTP